MIRLRVTVTLCLLCFLAVSLAEDAGSEREVREANDDFSTAAKTYKDVLVRQKRDWKDKYCGICHPDKNRPVMMPCIERKYQCIRWKKTGRWWRKHTVCAQYGYVFVRRFCCQQGLLIHVVLYKTYLCIDKKSPCGGILTRSRSARACVLNGRRFCLGRYRLRGSTCSA
ncbi:hypothetical protein LSAT2_022823 [Lamellibrachia satsuma]|nr:hypothetical protein LSAT2_022823 [Lamellibrachia satsuma]